MKLSVSELRRIIKEEARRIIEADGAETSDAGSPVDAAKAIVSSNSFVSKNADAVEEKTLVPLGTKYLFFAYPGVFDHTLRTHGASSTNAGSKFSSDVSSESGLMGLIGDAAEGSPKVVNGRYKWLGVDLKSPVGTDAVRKAEEGEGAESEDYEEIKNIKALPAILKGGSKVVGPDKKSEITPEESAEIAAAPPVDGDKYYVKQNLKTVEGEQSETSLVNLILSPIGKTSEDSVVKWTDGKERTLVSLVSLFPGVSTDDSGNELTSKEAFVKAGYVFINKKADPKVESAARRGVVLIERWQKLAGLIK